MQCKAVWGCKVKDVAFTLNMNINIYIFFIRKKTQFILLVNEKLYKLGPAIILG